MEEDLASRLLANVALAALVDTRINWIERPEGEVLPAITLQVISSGRSYTHDGAANLTGSLVQVDIWAESYASSKVIYRALLPAIEPALTVGTTKFSQSFLDAARDMPTEKLGGGVKVYRVSADFIVWHQPV